MGVPKACRSDDGIHAHIGAGVEPSGLSILTEYGTERSTAACFPDPVPLLLNKWSQVRYPIQLSFGQLYKRHDFHDSAVIIVP